VLARSDTERGAVGRFETTIPAEGYEDGTLSLPILAAARTDGGHQKVDPSIPAMRDLGVDGPLEFDAGQTVEFTVYVAPLCLAVDGPWTYTVGFGTVWK
jgi:hypothetical protein